MEKEKDFTTDLIENIEKAKNIAEMFRTKTISVPFTLIKLSQLTRIPYDECRQKLNFIAQYGFAYKVKRNGVELFSINHEPEKRLLFLEKDKQMLLQQVNFINAIQQVVQGEIEEKEKESSENSGEPPLTETEKELEEINDALNWHD